MSITQGVRQAGRQLARLMPHDAVCQLPGVQGPPTENKYGEQIPGEFQPGPVFPCHVSLLDGKDANIAGLGGTKWAWRVVIDRPLSEVPVASDSAVTVTRADGEVLSLTVDRVSGTQRVTLECQRAS